MHVQHFYENRLTGVTHMVEPPQPGDLWRVTTCGVRLNPDTHVHTNPETAVTCNACIYEQARCDQAAADDRKKSPLETFDEAVSKVTTERGNVYGHPADDFARVDAIKAAVASCPDPLLRHCLEMLAVKMSRLAKTPEHLDSWIDIFGYARCAVMIIDRRQKRPHPLAGDPIETLTFGPFKSSDLTARKD